MNRLSKRERTAVQVLLERGYSARAIGRMLGIHRHTIASVCDRTVVEQERRMGRPALGDKGKTSTINVRFTEAENALIVEKAKNSKSVSEWIRRTLRSRAKEILP